MKNTFNAIKVGVVAIISLLLLYFGGSWLKGNLYSGITLYSVYDNVSGLTVGSAVNLNGHKIGSVTNIDFDTLTNLIVEFSIPNDLEIPLNSIAKIVSVDLMGTKGVSIILGDSVVNASSGEILESEIEFSLQEEVNAQILPLKNKAEELIGSIDSVVTVITAVLNKDARSSLNKSLVSLDNTFTTLSSTMVKVDKMVIDNEENINNILNNFSEVSKGLSESNQEIKNILTNFSSISDSLENSNLASTINKIDNIINKINKSEGSLGKLMNDEDLYKNLLSASKEIDELIADVKKNPERYVNISLIGGSKKKTNKFSKTD